MILALLAAGFFVLVLWLRVIDGDEKRSEWKKRFRQLDE